jgi:alpha-tubulin suppressor-like RCC1 family protein
MTTRLRRFSVAVAVVLLGTLSPIAVQAESNEGTTAPIVDDQRLITAGGLHTCAVLDTGHVQCWGANANGQLGNGTTAISPVPQEVDGITTALSVTGGSTHTCALLYGGTVQCWGNNGSGQLGNGRTSPPDAPVLKPVVVQDDHDGNPATNTVDLSGVTAIAAGGFHTCAVRTGGEVACWGHDGSGQLGNGSGGGTSYLPAKVVHDHDTDTTTPMVPLTGVTAVAAGEYHTCALIGATGAVKCWGNNGSGQLGNGATPLPAPDRTSATPVTGIPDGGHKATALTAGQAHTCAVLDDGTVRCWGQGFFGQLGNNTSGDGNDTSTPVKAKRDIDGDPTFTPGDIGDIVGVTAIGAGQFHTCARITGGTVRCWGQNGRGQLGDGTTSDRKVAFPVPGLSGVRAVTSGGFHTCVLKTGNALNCWGYNFYGQLGSYEPSSLVPVTVTALSGARTVDTGNTHACALVSTAEVPPTEAPQCWGSNANGELGTVLTPTPANSRIPVKVTSITDVGNTPPDIPASAPELEPLMTAGNRHNCAIPWGSGTPQCWGRNTNGELGNGTNSPSTTPVPVSLLSNATQVSGGGELDAGVSPQVEVGHTCALRSDGTVSCWGFNGYGGLGDESTTNRNAPVTVRSDHDNDHLKTTTTANVDLTGATAVAAGGRHSCALVDDGRVRCWGRNFDGQLGDGTNDDRAYAVTVDTNDKEPDGDGDHFEPLEGIVAIVAGARHNCALKNDDTIWCWGRNTDGQLGDGTTDPRTEPVQVTGLSTEFWDVVSLASGEFHTCARIKSKKTDFNLHANNTTMACWGDNTYGQLGDGGTTDSPTPVAPSTLGEPGDEVKDVEIVTSISATRTNTCAALVEVTVMCWGDNTHGQLGDGVGVLRKAPVLVEGLAAAVGGNHIPAPVDDAATTAESTAVTITVKANDKDADGHALTVALVPSAGPGRGTATTDGTTVTYTPNADFCTVDPTSNTETFDYSVTDGTATVPATITVSVTCPNTAPTATDDSATTAEETAVLVDVLANDSDINGDAMTVSTVGVPSHGAAVIESNKVKYTPAADWFGTDTFTYKVTDSHGAPSADATVTVTVSNVNDPPVANDDAGSTNEDTAVVVDVIGNDTDTDGPSLAVGSVGAPAHGSAAATSPTEITYTPHPGYCGADGFAYNVSDGTATDAGTVAVTVSCVNDGPNAGDDSATTAEDTPTTIDVLANDTDPEGDTLTVTAVTDPPHGTVANNGTNITYTPDPDFCGADDFGYTASDGSASDSALVIPVIVTCQNDSPVANDDSASTSEDTSVGVAVVSNDVDPDGNPLSLTAVTDPAHGTAAVATGTVASYTPDPNYCGADSFTYTISDNYGGTATATVSVAVACVNDAPRVGSVGTQTLPWGEDLSAALSVSDPDAGDTATYSLVSGPVGVSVGGSNVVWTPTAAQVGTHTVIVRGTDSGGASDDETFNVVVGRRATAVAYTGPASGQYSDPVAVGATLVDFEGAPVAGRTVSFAIGSRSASGSTGAGGSAGAVVVLADAAGSSSVATSFVGDAAYLPSSDSDAFTVEKEQVAATFKGARVTTTGGSSSVVQLVADVAEEGDTSLGMGSATLQVTFTQVGGGVLCSGPVSGTTPGNGTATCSTTALSLGSRAVIAKVSSAKYAGPADVGSFVVAPTPGGNALGGGRVGGDDFAFQAKPVRKAPPAGDALHVRRSGGTAYVTHTGSLTSLAMACSGGKAKSCSATVEGGSSWQYSVDLAAGTWTLLGTGGPTLRVDATDAAEPDGTGADRYGAAVGAPDSYTLPDAVLTAGNIRIVP